MLCFIYETQKYIVNLFSYERTEAQELSVYTMKYRLQKVTLSRILRVE